MSLPDQFAGIGQPVKLTMRELADTFLYCFTTELNRVSQTNRDDVDAVLQRFEQLVGKRKPYFMFGPTQLVEMSGIVFGDTPLSSPVLTDFILSLTVSLQAHLIRQDQAMLDLFRDLTNSLVVLEEDAEADVNATSEAFSERFSSQDLILRTLKANRWLVTILLGSMFLPEIIVAAEEVIKSSSRKGKMPPKV
jgi:hypothetical protein